MDPSALRWDGGAGHLEAWQVTLSDPAGAIGLTIRHALRSPADGGPARCGLSLALSGPGATRHVERATFPIASLHAARAPFRLSLAGADLGDRGAAGAIGGASWELSWTPAAPPAQPVPATLRRPRLAGTALVVAHPDLRIDGTLRVNGASIELAGAPGALAHAWGRRYPPRWVRAHCCDLRGVEGEPRPGSYVEGISVAVERRRRERGPLTALVGRLLGDELRCACPLRSVLARSASGLSTWRLSARDGAREVVGEVHAPRDSLVGLAFGDPDGRPVHCYNSDVATMRLHVRDRVHRRAVWTSRDTLVGQGRAHFEYAQRASVALP